MKHLKHNYYVVHMNTKHRGLAVIISCSKASTVHRYLIKHLNIFNKKLLKSSCLKNIKHNHLTTGRSDIHKYKKNLCNIKNVNRRLL